MRNEILLLGEAWGEEEAREGLPFIGMAGKILNGMLREVGIRREECHVTNVFNLRPPGGNDVSNLCGQNRLQGFPPLSKGKYCDAKYAPELSRLEREISHIDPNLIVALGATAAWAVCRTTGIKNIRGAPMASRDGRKVLPTYHPAAVGRDWTLRPVVLADLSKAKWESTFPDIRRPERFIHIEPSIADLIEFEIKYIQPSDSISIDIETKADQITCIGFAPTPDRALVVPFFDRESKWGSYWKTPLEEAHAWKWVKRICALPKRIVFQNGNYDMHFLLRRYGIIVPSAQDDTMLLHHALQPEMEKGLGFLATLYTNEAQWKFMRAKHDTVKRED